MDLSNFNVNKTEIINESGVVRENYVPRMISNHPKQEVLGFVTPWNPEGYDLALEFGNRFSFIVPTWFHMAISPNFEISIKGEDVVNMSWVEKMQLTHSNVIISPRLLLDVDSNYFVAHFNAVMATIKANLVNLFQKYPFNSVFVEFPTLLYHPHAVTLIPLVIKEIKKAFQSSHSTILFDCLSPLRIHYSPSVLKAIKDSLKIADMCFISNYENPSSSSISPISVLNSTIQTLTSDKGFPMKKVLIGLPFFGFHYSGQSRDYIFGNDYIRILNNPKVTFKWMDSIMEHVVFYRTQTSNTVYYPSPHFLNHRIEQILKSPLGGIGIWEISQGLPCFFDLL